MNKIETNAAYDHKARVMAEKSASDVRKQGLDKFYTLPNISNACIQKIGSKYDWAKWDIVVEPSAGNGSFLQQIPTSKRIGLDIAPEHKDVVKKDFFQYSPPPGLTNILIVGNPPFGRVSSLAVKFFNHAAQWASVIAFIVPKTFRRISLQNRLDTKFHLMYDTDIPSTPCSFHPKMNVKCCFQIWEAKSTPRTIQILQTTHADWEFLSNGPLDSNKQPTPPKHADFAILAYGSDCGKIAQTDLETLRPKSWHWIKANIPIETLIQRFQSLDYSLSKDTARQNSIGKGELVKLYATAFPV